MKLQVQFLSKLLERDSPLRKLCLKKTHLPLASWEEASKQIPAWEFNFDQLRQFSADIAAHIVNGQIGNDNYLRDFFKSFFEKGKEEEIEYQKALLAHLKPEVLDFLDGLG